MGFDRAAVDRQHALMEKEAIEAAVTTIAPKTTYGGAATSILGWLASSEFTVIVGLFVAVAGLAVNWYYKAKADRRQADDAALRSEERKLRMELMRRTGRPIANESDRVPLEDAL